jgi:hypothetical protein
VISGSMFTERGGTGRLGSRSYRLDVLGAGGVSAGRVSPGRRTSSLPSAS